MNIVTATPRNGSLPGARSPAAARPADPRPHILVVFGTRPEAIKMIPIVKALRRSAAFRVTVAATGQHRQMLDQVCAVFGEWPDIDLDVMRPDQSLAGLTASVVAAVAPLLAETRPDMLLVQGDTTTAMAAALAAFYARIRIGHVEAGLRTFDLDRPWPEELNRVVIDAMADYRFAPTAAARDHLLQEYGRDRPVFVTGNTGIDALLEISALIESDGEIRADLSRRYDPLIGDRRLVLVTGHRRESFGDGFRRICEALAALAARDDIRIVYPVHLNPNVREVVFGHLGALDAVELLEPVQYVDMVYLMKRATVILTDSGGVQEEAPALGTPVLVMRDTTERPEAIATGVARLVGTDPATIRREVDLLLDSPVDYHARARPVFPYGDGSAARQIAGILETDLVRKANVA